ncbi:hypothetical protein RHSIM_Rhsim02G0180000 [Rhododendron simsii]|uniref:RNase H type-1 domain-containing protein n=1 Tax=Rhododendron simsii TaxID=118357 RepID=A0A834LWY3_RHOSS|nr:hypothetical protein RHSIM_Rhsim02G0180000 [Rhododendron simsii]
MGKIKLRTKFGGIEEDTEFLVIDVDTFYNALLGRPWSHNHMAVPSTYHQCIKYPLPPPINVGIIVADNDPFNGIEAYYANAHFYTKASQNRLKGSTKIDTKSVKAQTRKASRYKEGISLHSKKAECTYVETYRKFVVLAKAKGMKAIVFHALGDMEKKVQDDNLKTVELLSPIRPNYAANIIKMLVKAGLDPENVSTQTVAPFDSGFGYQAAKEKLSVNMITEEGVSDEGIEDETYPVPTQSEERGQATIDELHEVNLGYEGENKPTFISANLQRKRLKGRCLPFSRLMKKGVPFEWDQSCQNAFDSIKAYLMKPPVLMSPTKGKPLLLSLVGAELNYSSIEKTCLALVFALQKLRHYVLEHEVKLISKADPLKYILSRPILSRKIAKWAVIIQQFAIEYVSQNAVKGQSLADFLAAHPIPDDSPLATDLPDEEVMQVEIQKAWEMCFDGATKSPNGQKQDLKYNKSEIGVVFVTPNNAIIPHSFALTEGCSNNEAEYEAVIAGLELALQIAIEELLIYGDSEKVNIFHDKKRINAQAGSLASLAASLSLPDRETITVTVRERRVLQPLTEISEVLPVFAATTKESDDDWREPFINYLQHGRLPEDKAKRAEKVQKIRMVKLESLDERRLYVQQNLEIYRQRMANAFNKRVWLRSFKKGDLVLMVRRPIVISRRTKGKLEPKWDGPYVIEKVYSIGAYLLITMDASGSSLPPMQGS